MSEIFEAAVVYAQTYTKSDEKSVPGYLTHLFEQAILAERKRCAEIAWRADIDNATALWVLDTINSGEQP